MHTLTLMEASREEVGVSTLPPSPSLLPAPVLSSNMEVVWEVSGPHSVSRGNWFWGSPLLPWQPLIFEMFVLLKNPLIITLTEVKREKLTFLCIMP